MGHGEGGWAQVAEREGARVRVSRGRAWERGAKDLVEESCYVTVGTFTRRGLDSISNDTELSWLGFGVLSPKGT